MSEPKITGYRQQSEESIAAINECKDLEKAVSAFIEKISADQALAVDARAVSIARTQLQTGFMWLVRGIAKPTV
jgi:hypothetical protein